MPHQRPLVSDLLVWQQQLLEHRRTLLEIVIKEFPEVMLTKRTTIDMLRLKFHLAIAKPKTT